MTNEETIDKKPFKVTIPTLIWMVAIVASVCGGYYNLLSSIADVNSRVAQVYVEVQNGNKEHANFQKMIDDHENRIRTLEKQ